MTLFDRNSPALEADQAPKMAMPDPEHRAQAEVAEHEE
jgi:hypothetical protein